MINMMRSSSLRNNSNITLPLSTTAHIPVTGCVAASSAIVMSLSKAMRDGADFGSGNTTSTVITKLPWLTPKDSDDSDSDSNDITHINSNNIIVFPVAPTLCSNVRCVSDDYASLSDSSTSSISRKRAWEEISRSNTERCDPDDMDQVSTLPRIASSFFQPPADAAIVVQDQQQQHRRCRRRRRRLCLRVTFHPALETAHYSPRPHHQHPQHAAAARTIATTASAQTTIAHQLEHAPLLDRSTLWYTKREIRKMQHQSKQLARLYYFQQQQQQRRDRGPFAAAIPTTAESNENSNDPSLEEILQRAYNLHSAVPITTTMPLDVSLSLSPTGSVPAAVHSNNNNISNRHMHVDMARCLGRHVHFSERRGLERLASPRHALTQHMTVLAAQTEVFLQQAATRMTRAVTTTTTPAGVAVAAAASAVVIAADEMVAESYARASQPAAHFAHLLALADAETVAQEHAAMTTTWNTVWIEP